MVVGGRVSYWLVVWGGRWVSGGKDNHTWASVEEVEDWSQRGLDSRDICRGRVRGGDGEI